MTQNCRSGFSTYQIAMDPAGFQLFGYLLESVEGLGTHSRGDEPNQLTIMTPNAQQLEWERFLDLWNEFSSKMVVDADNKQASPNWGSASPAE